MTAAEKKAKVGRQKKYAWVIMNGKKVRIKRPVLIDGMLVSDWIEINADDIWLTQNEMFDVLDVRQQEKDENMSSPIEVVDRDESEIPF